MYSKKTHMGFVSRTAKRARFLAATAFLALLLMPAVAAVGAGLGFGTGSGVVLAQANPNDPPAAADPNAVPQLGPQKNDVNSCPKGACLFQLYINPAVKVVTALVGIGVTMSIIIGGIQYATSADSPQKVSAAKTRIVKAVFILLAYFLFYAFLNWVIPGGITGSGG